MENYLEHHGIKGQKWGIRRYQNEDGTLTEEGKERYGNDTSDSKKEDKKENKDKKLSAKDYLHLARMYEYMGYADRNYFKKLTNGHLPYIEKRRRYRKAAKKLLRSYRGITEWNKPLDKREVKTLARFIESKERFKMSYIRDYGQ